LLGQAPILLEFIFLSIYYFSLPFVRKNKILLFMSSYQSEQDNIYI